VFGSEGARPFVKSWNELMEVIESRSRRDPENRRLSRDIALMRAANSPVAFIKGCTAMPANTSSG
jgi:hypothetical protein